MPSRLQWVCAVKLSRHNGADRASSGPRNRAPLGVKTTNAKTKAFNIPPPPSVEDVPDKSPQKSASARKSRPRVSHAEMTKLEVLGDLDELGDREIEYMPPPAKRNYDNQPPTADQADRT